MERNDAHIATRLTVNLGKVQRMWQRSRDYQSIKWQWPVRNTSTGRWRRYAASRWWRTWGAWARPGPGGSGCPGGGASSMAPGRFTLDGPGRWEKAQKAFIVEGGWVRTTYFAFWEACLKQPFAPATCIQFIAFTFLSDSKRLNFWGLEN